MGKDLFFISDGVSRFHGNRVGILSYPIMTSPDDCRHALSLCRQKDGPERSHHSSQLFIRRLPEPLFIGCMKETVIRLPHWYKIMLFSGSFQILIGHFAEGFIPLLTHTANERFFQKLVNTHLFVPSQNLGGLANLPTVIVERRITVCPALHTHGIKMTRERLEKGRTALAIGFFKGTIANAVVTVASKDTVAPVDDRGHKVGLLIDIRNALFPYHGLGCGAEVVPHSRQSLFDGFPLFGSNGCTGIPVDTAFAATCLDIANEKPLYDVERNKGILYL